jgi:endo-1,4-beta-xylanase
MKKIEKLSIMALLCFVCLTFTSCENDPAEAMMGLSCDQLHLKNASDVPVGLSFSNRQINEASEPIILNESDQITSTQFFASLIWRGVDNYDFSQADFIVDYAARNGKKVHGHCLVYPFDSVNPDFVKHFNGSNEELEELFKNFITATLSRYKGKVRGYDLTNELFAFNSSETQDSWLRRRFSSDKEFFDFIGRCFRYAHAADPKALLFYNDYGQEFSNNNFEKSRAIVAQIEQWKKEGVPVHGYGLQIHTNTKRPIEHIETALKMAVSTGLQVHISELDISLNWVDWDIDNIPTKGVQGISYISDEMRYDQKEMYRKVAEAYRKTVPKKQQYGITMWDLTDKYSWLAEQRFEAGTMFDESYQRKPAFYGFLEGLAGKRFDCN